MMTFPVSFFKAWMPFILSASLCMLLLFPVSVFCQRSVLRVGFSEHPPWKVREADGGYGGIDIELLRVLAERVGLGLEFVDYPFKRALEMAAIGEVDIVTGVFKRRDREKDLYFIEPAYKKFSNKAFFVLKGRESSIRRHEDLIGKTLGTIVGAKYYPAFDKDKRIMKSPVTRTELNFKMLLAGRINAFIMTESAGEYRRAQLGMEDVVSKADFIYREKQNVYMVLSRKSIFVKYLKEMNRQMRILVESGEINRIKARFYKRLRTR